MKLTKGFSPHIHDNVTAAQLMGHVLLALLPALAMGVWQLGWPALWVSLSCTAAAVAAQSDRLSAAVAVMAAEPIFLPTARL